MSDTPPEPPRDPARDPARVPGVQVIGCVNDLYDIRFDERGLAAVEVPFRLLDALPLVGAERSMGPRLRALIGLIRRQGYVPAEPIICRVGMKGRWVVIDGGHRLSAARIVGREFWSNLLRPKVTSLYFLLYTTPDSWSKLRPALAPMARALGARPRSGEGEGGGGP